MVYTILWLALVESSAIYWLVVAFSILWKESITMLTAISAWLAVGIPWWIVWLVEWKLVSSSFDAMNRNPDNKWKVLSFMILFLALIEVIAIYWLIIAFQILG